MKKFMKLCLVIGFVFIISSMSVFAAAEEYSKGEISPEIVAAAEKELLNFQEMISKSYWKYDFKNAEEIKSTKLGEGFQVWGIDQEKLAESSSTKILDVIKPLDQWSFIVTLDGVPKTMITIGLENNSFNFIGGGGDTSAFDPSLSETSEKTKLVRINDVDMLVSEMPSGEITKSLNPNTPIVDEMVAKLREKQQYNDQGEILYGAAPIVEKTVAADTQLPVIYGSISILSLAAIAFIFWKLRKGSTTSL